MKNINFTASDSTDRSSTGWRDITVERNQGIRQSGWRAGDHENNVIQIRIKFEVQLHLIIEIGPTNIS